MFEVEKPRQFHYVPRFYDPEKEKWEALKKKYAIEQEKKESALQAEESSTDQGNTDLQYFEQRVKDLDAEKRSAAGKITWRDMFRKRELPKFNYQPRFQNGIDTLSDSTEKQNVDNTAETDSSLVEKYSLSRHQIKIKRRFDISDTDYMKPISGTKIILYCFIAFLLITLIISF